MPRPRGVDVSRWQGDIDWAAVAADGIEFVSIRATVGDFYTDDKFSDNWRGAEAAQLFRAAYHVLRPDIDPVAQIDHFESVVGGSGELPHVLDVELTGSQSDRVIRERTLECLLLMQARFGRAPIVYTADWFWTPHIGAQEWVDDYDLWAANYYWPATPTPKIPAGWMVWRIWQYSDKGSVAGINGDVDLNWFGGRQADLAAFAAQETPPPQTTIENRVADLENWAAELDPWARAEGYDGIDPGGEYST